MADRATALGFLGAPLGILVGGLGGMIAGGAIAANWGGSGTSAAAILPGLIGALIGGVIGAPVGLIGGIYIGAYIGQTLDLHEGGVRKAELRVLLERAFTELDERNWDQAVVSLTEVIRLNPALIEAYQGRAIGYLELNKLDHVIADCNHIIEVGWVYITRSWPVPPYVADAYAQRGSAFARMGQHDKAIADFTEAIQLASDVPTPYERRAHSRRAIGDTKGAAEDELKAHDLASGSGVLVQRKWDKRPCSLS